MLNYAPRYIYKSMDSFKPSNLSTYTQFLQEQMLQTIKIVPKVISLIRNFK